MYYLPYIKKGAFLRDKKKYENIAFHEEFEKNFSLEGRQSFLNHSILRNINFFDLLFNIRIPQFKMYKVNRGYSVNAI